MEEAVEADRVVVMDKGKILLKVHQEKYLVK